MLTSRPSVHGFKLALIAAASLAIGASTTLAQTTPASLKLPTTSDTPVETGRVTKPGTMRLMARPVTIDFNETRLEDAVKFLTEYTGAQIEPHWAESGGEGLDKELAVTMKIKGVPALVVLERLLEKAKTDFSENTWQMTELGALECGPKSILNRSKRLEIYSIYDLLFENGTYEEVPQIDLQSLLQQSQGGGGGGQSPFRDDQNDRERDREQTLMREQERANQIIELITGLVEPDQWSDAGGEGGTIKLFQKTLIVNAPDYMHRSINGYKWWPAGSKATKVADRRYVSLNMGAENGTIDGIRQFPVSAVVGGQVISSDPSQNPGGSTAPAGGTDPKGKRAKTTTKKTAKPAAKQPAPKPKK